MLTREENESLTRVGPGTPMGELLRRYWQPIAPAGQLRERKVMPVRLLGEDLVLFRDKSGRMGLVAERCAHRRVQLKYGFPVEDGLRCPYHGWTYDGAGRCVAQPGEPDDSTFKDKIRIGAYPVQELAGLILAYLGPEPAPLLPRWDRLVWNNVYRVAGIAAIPCNWLQCMENSADPVHTEYLHGQFYNWWLGEQGVPAGDPRWRLSVGFSRHHVKIDFALGEFGVYRRAMREHETEQSEMWRVAHPFLFPNTHVTSGNGRHTFGWRVPVDDTHTNEVYVRVFDPGEGAQVPEQTEVPWVETKVVDEAGNWGALNTVLGQDAMAWAAQGDIMDRTTEHLGETDRGVILYRKLLQQQLKVVQDGGEPMNVFRDAARNQCIELPCTRDRGNDWGVANDGSYVRGAVTAGEPMPEWLRNEIEDLFVAAAERRRTAVPA